MMQVITSLPEICRHAINKPILTSLTWRHSKAAARGVWTLQRKQHSSHNSYTEKKNPSIGVPYKSRAMILSSGYWNPHHHMSIVHACGNFLIMYTHVTAVQRQQASAVLSLLELMVVREGSKHTWAIHSFLPVLSESLACEARFLFTKSYPFSWTTSKELERCEQQWLCICLNEKKINTKNILSALHLHFSFYHTNTVFVSITVIRCFHNGFQAL